MAEIYMYADETGDLGLDGGPGSSAFFGIGTATFVGEHGAAIWAGLRLRFELEQSGLNLPKGFHAKDDSWKTRGSVFSLVQQQAPRFDTTFLTKDRLYSRVKARGQSYVYKLAWFLHFKEIATQVSEPGDTLHVIASTLQTNKRKNTVREALTDVCDQGPPGREIVLCVWDGATSWGLQVADYGLWAVQRRRESGKCEWWDCVEPTLRSEFYPFGRP
ncbi:DUF3800 domain-containing protein [Pseudonocardia sp. NPDC049635]|uniref:DUF3800 domain-containing protein n=1 Tax=Pseudonocardia sp. NPDC049635 TaxID=3155506 RepID=UPI0033EA7C9F